ncbi:MAG: glutathione S-transferase [Myxococcota bacterium]|jgi:glutathione S-transferase
MSLPRPLDLLTSFAASTARFWGGIRMLSLGPRPGERLVLYEFEGCPFCRRVREAITLLDLEVEVRPCPKKGGRFRPEVVAQGGKAQFPYLIDPNTDTAMYESADITAYLFATYGAGLAPWSLTGPLFVPSSMLASWLRPLAGSRCLADPDRAPAEPLVLYGAEGSPYCRIVREALSELELPFFLKSTPVDSARWQIVKASSPTGQVPYLIDPNTSTAMCESADIRRYLFSQYG